MWSFGMAVTDQCNQRRDHPVIKFRLRRALLTAAAAAAFIMPAFTLGAAADAHAAAMVTGRFDAINKGTTLEPGDYIYVYPNGGDGDLVTLRMQTDGNLVESSDNTDICFATHTNGNSGAYATYQSNGALIVLSETGRPLWSSGPTSGTTVSLNENNGSFYVGTKFFAGPCY
jgi:hypothetical protein